MKQSTAANISLAFALIGWLAVAWGGLSFLGDPATDTPPELIRRHLLIGHSAFFLGLIALAVSMWLAGYAWSCAKRRSVFAFLLICAPIFLTLIPLFR